MRLMRSLPLALAAAATLALAVPAQAAPVDGKTARKALFRNAPLVLEPVEVPDLPAALAAQVEALLASMGAKPSLRMLAQSGYGYYGAIAVPTGVERLAPADLTVSANLHSPKAAEAVAKKTCESAHEACAVVGLFLPKGYEPRPVTLNAAATEAFLASWRKGKGPRTLAASASTDAWAIAKGPGADAAALARCNEAAGQEDCAIVIADEK